MMECAKDDYILCLTYAQKVRRGKKCKSSKETKNKNQSFAEFFIVKSVFNKSTLNIVVIKMNSH